MEKYVTKMTLIPLNDDEVTKYGLSDVVALYRDSKSGVINVGRPSLAPYYPSLANMFGFYSALEKGYYFVLKEKVDIRDKRVYSVVINSSQTILEVSQVNTLSEEELDVNLKNEASSVDILANICQKNEIRK